MMDEMGSVMGEGKSKKGRMGKQGIARGTNNMKDYR